MRAQAEPWRFTNTGFNSGAFNMEFDERMARSVQSGAEPPTVRVYGWKPHAISLGHHQAITDIDEKACRDRGIDIVRRATGGRAILHAHELTYSIAMHAAGRTISDVYASISEALACGLRTLGARVEFAAVQPEFSVLYKQPSAIPCFASSARHEIQFEGKKLVGSAQRRYASQDFPETVMQHGSILLGEEHQQLIDLLALRDESLRERMRKGMIEKTTTLESILGRRVGFDEAACALKTGFEQCWGIHFIDAQQSSFAMSG
ncbi:MAG TPA: lipoate--protein ligase family protein [Bacteroidota bacterium]|nr:lipoate--protein ligase family protein [Bacteroidota bacterium]